MATDSGPLWKPEKRKHRVSMMGDPVRLPRGMFRRVPDKLWESTKIDWFELNPPDLGEEWYQCALCPKPVHKDEVTLDHIQTRSSRPDLKYKLDNLQPAHYLCNAARGSMSMEAWNKFKDTPDK
jgi:5-methylcytosine-specific restriction endonuclease McrA